MARPRKFGWIPDTPDGRDITEEQALVGVAADDIETSDLTEHEPSPPLYQGNSNTCVAHFFSAAAVICESQAGLPKVPPSRNDIYYNAVRKMTPAFLPILDRGCMPRVAATMLQKKGAAPETHKDARKARSFSDRYLSVRRRPTFHQEIAGHSRAGGSYFRIAATGEAKGRAVRQCLGLGLPVGVAMPVDDFFQQNVGPEVVGPMRPERVVGRHMMLIDRHRPSSEHVWEYGLLNWWGNDWREYGRTWMSEELLREDSTTDLIVFVGWEAIRMRFDRDEKLAAWREVTHALQEARLDLA